MSDAQSVFEQLIAAFNALDFERFVECLAPEVSLFAPASSEPGLIEHTTAVQAHFRKVFQVESPSGPGIRPGNVRVRSIGDQAALVTFEFERSGHSTGRRTIVLQHGVAGWKVVHVHASNTESREAGNA